MTMVKTYATILSVKEKTERLIMTNFYIFLWKCSVESDEKK